MKPRLCKPDRQLPSDYASYQSRLSWSVPLALLPLSYPSLPNTYIESVADRTAINAFVAL